MERTKSPSVMCRHGITPGAGTAIARTAGTAMFFLDTTDPPNQTDEATPTDTLPEETIHAAQKMQTFVDPQVINMTFLPSPVAEIDIPSASTMHFCVYMYLLACEL